MKNESFKKSGFTLLELLIVIAIIAILSVVVVLFINPVEMLKKGRDVQRISDLATMKTAISLYLQDSASNSLGTTVACGTPSASLPNTNGTPSTGGLIRSTVASSTAYADGFTATTSNDGGTGASGVNSWIPVNFAGVSSGAPVSNLPLDPVNTDTSAGAYFYRYGCWTNSAFEIDATLESDAFTVVDDRRTKDGGNSTIRYEVGTDLRILPAGL